MLTGGLQMVGVCSLSLLILLTNTPKHYFQNMLGSLTNMGRFVQDKLPFKEPGRNLCPGEIRKKLNLRLFGVCFLTKIKVDPESW